MDHIVINSQTEIINQIKYARMQQGLTQKELAIRAGVTQQTISAFESGSFNPSLNILWKLLKALKFKLSLESM